MSATPCASRPQMLYCSMVQNASGIVMIEALRNIGLPTVAWHQ